MKRIVSAAIAACVAGIAFAESTPVMVSLVTPVQTPSSDCDVAGFRLSLIYGQAQDFAGLDIGIANHSRKDFTGLGIGGVNIAGERFYGGQIGLVNYANHMDGGCQIGFLNIISHGGFAPVCPIVNGSF